MDFNEALEKLEDVKLRKLKEYEVRIIERTVRVVYVEAYDLEDAEERVDEMVASGEIDLCDGRFDEYSLDYETMPCDPDDEEDEYE